MEIPDIPDFRSFIVLSNMNAIVKSSVFQCLNLHPTQETWFKTIFLKFAFGRMHFSIVNFIFLGIHAVTIIFSTQKLFLTVFCHFVLVYCSLEEKLFLIFYKSDFFYSRSLCRHGKNWFWQNWIGMWIWSSLRTILICSASIWISCQRLMMPINEVPPRMKKQVMIYHTSIKPNFYLTQNTFCH